MIRFILLPGFLMVLVGMSALGYGLWDLHLRSNWNPQQAYDGDLAAERALASCYKAGCPSIPLDRDAACAWRHIIANESKHPAPADTAAVHVACSTLPSSDEKWVRMDEREIEKRMGDHKGNHLTGGSLGPESFVRPAAFSYAEPVRRVAERPIAGLLNPSSWRRIVVRRVARGMPDVTPALPCGALEPNDICTFAGGPNYTPELARAKRVIAQSARGEFDVTS